MQLAFSYVNRFCVALWYGRAGRLTAENGGFRPGQVAAKPFLIFLVVMVFVYPTVTKNALEIYNCVDYEGTRGASV